MQISLVSSNGQITIPKEIRQQLGIEKGSIIDAVVVDQHIELHVSNIDQNLTGFEMLKSNKKAVPTDFNPADLLNNDRT